MFFTNTNSPSYMLEKKYTLPALTIPQSSINSSLAFVYTGKAL